MQLKCDGQFSLGLSTNSFKLRILIIQVWVCLAWSSPVGTYCWVWNQTADPSRISAITNHLWKKFSISLVLWAITRIIFRVLLRLPNCWRIWRINMLQVLWFGMMSWRRHLSVCDKNCVHHHCSSLFCKMQSPVHCLNLLLPPKKITDYKLRNSNCNYVLPQCSFDAFKRSFVNWSIFSL